MLAARAARQRNDLPQAARLLRQAEKHGAAMTALNLEGRLLIAQSGNARVADEIWTFCERNPDNEEAPAMLQAVAEGFLRNQDLPRARAAANLWLKVKPGDADQAQGFLWLGQADKLANEGGPALAHFQKAVDLAPDHSLARILLVATLVHDQPEQARPHLELLRRRRPDDPEVVFQTVRMHRYLGETEEAARLLDQVLQSNSNSVPALLERGRVALDQQRPHDAEPLLRKAFGASPGNRFVNVSMADCLKQLGRPNEAKAFEDRAEEIDKKAKRPPGVPDKAGAQDKKP